MDNQGRGEDGSVHCNECGSLWLKRGVRKTTATLISELTMTTNDSTICKEDYLPIEKTDFGFVQKTKYYQPDLYHEEVIELDSPFASIVASGTQVYTFLFLGDQNAGKSTFIHSFTYYPDPNFLELSTTLPILTSTFLNTRFLVDPQRQPRDEMPFLDTDIGRGTVLIGRSDFEFFLEENGICLEEYPQDTRYIVLQFIEIGGDHLDLIMSPLNSIPTQFHDIVNRSIQLLKEARKTVYFVNLNNLLQPLCDNTNNNNVTIKNGDNREVDNDFKTKFLEINPNSYHTLLNRLRFLNKTLPQNHEILLYLSRIPSNDRRLHFAKISQQTGIDFKDMESATNKELEVTIVEVIQRLLFRCAIEENWTIKLVGIFTSNHLNVDGSLNPQNIIQTLVRLFKSQMTHSKEEPEKFVAQYLIQCFKEAHHRFTKDGVFQLWISKETFYEYLLNGNIGITEVPENVLVQKFERVVQIFANNNLCLIHYGGNHSNICVQFQFHSDTTKEIFFWSPVSSESERVQKLEIRFPYFAPLFDIINTYFIYNIPAEFWLQKAPLTKISDLEIAKQLSWVLDQQLTSEIDKQLDNILQLQQKPEQYNEESYNIVHTFFWLLEEWVMGYRLLERITEMTTVSFPRHKKLRGNNSKYFLIDVLQLRKEAPPIVLQDPHLTIVYLELDVEC